MNSMISPLRLENCFTEELTVKTNPSFAPGVEKKKEGKLQCEVELAGNKNDPSKFRVGLSVSVEPSMEYPALDPYLIQVKITGVFGFSGDLPSEETMHRMVSLNGSSILYGIARGLVIEVTGNGRWGKYILPAVNFVQLLEQQSQKQKVHAKTSVSRPAPRKRRTVSAR